MKILINSLNTNIEVFLRAIKIISILNRNKLVPTRISDYPEGIVLVFTRNQYSFYLQIGDNGHDQITIIDTNLKYALSDFKPIDKKEIVKSIKDFLERY